MKKKSLDEINGSVDVPTVYESAFWEKFLAYSGPGALVAVGYMDPGNWLTSLAAGGQYGYSLLVVLFVSIIVAMIMQSLSIKLGVVTRTDLAQAIAGRVPKPIRIILWLLNELAMMATDLTGVVGTSVALYLLFKLPLIVRILLTVADVLIVLLFLRFGIRRVEFIVLTTILIVGIIGATIMPHNIYLHSALAQSRRYDEHDPAQVTETLKFANWDSVIHLVAALLVNALLLILSGTLFHHTGNLNSLADVFYGLKNPHIVGSLSSPLMSWLFGFALLITGLISSITSTLAGQIVMEGYINIRLPLWKRRLLTRFVTLIPIIIIGCVIKFNETQFEQLIIYAQIVLSVALPFTLFPLVAITSDSKLMGSHVNKHWQTVLDYLLVTILTGLNLMAIF